MKDFANFNFGEKVCIPINGIGYQGIPTADEKLLKLN